MSQRDTTDENAIHSASARVPRSDSKVRTVSGSDCMDGNEILGSAIHLRCKAGIIADLCLGFDVFSRFRSPI